MREKKAEDVGGWKKALVGGLELTVGAPVDG